jgi:hypothetical protein
VSIALLRVDVLDALAVVWEQRVASPHVSLADLVGSLLLGPVTLSGLDYSGALSLLNMCGGEELLSIAESRTSLYRHVLERATLHSNPTWLRSFLIGRDATFRVLSPNVLQCFTNARLGGLVLDLAAIQWWDRMSNQVRCRLDALNLEVGRKGEKLSLDYERTRLLAGGVSVCPSWVATVDNSAGYDIRSFDCGISSSSDHASERQIEVKTCRFSPPQFYITRNEWEVALRNRQSYIVHLWCLDNLSLRILRVSELIEHVPADVGQGRWDSLKISLDE